jgi:hypothetical protein
MPFFVRLLDELAETIKQLDIAFYMRPQWGFQTIISPIFNDTRGLQSQRQVRASWQLANYFRGTVHAGFYELSLSLRKTCVLLAAWRFFDRTTENHFTEQHVQGSAA